ncbi:DoxX family membrane protein [Labedella populi]|uniref:DoxX family membrane protein n=1 Tax=Labedella populi TaxID=2498850 RepID=A0A3S4AY01_9MICO|nr:DoxX family membrane protein [Labedella populi]
MSRGSRTRRRIGRIALGSFLAFAGSSHLTFAREEFTAQVPDFVPLPKDVTVLASGVVEVALGAALLAVKRKRPLVGWIVAAFFVAIFPGNIAQYVNKVDGFGLDTDAARLARLPFQPLLILWALWSTGAWRWFRARR